MNQWSARRKALTFFLAIVFLAIAIGLPAYFLVYEPPTCSDGKQNGDEAGVDCGGSCRLLCAAESLPLLAKGDPRVLEIAPGVYEVAAVFDNPNVSAEVLRARYVVKIYNSSLEVLETIESEVFIPKNSDFVVFEGPMEIEGEPVRATVEWRGASLVWERDEEPNPRPSVRNVLITGTDTNPRVEAVLSNDTLDRMENVEATALVRDSAGNVIAASKTFVEYLLPGGSVPIVFSWPSPFSSEPGNAEIVLRLLPDTSYIR